MKLSFRGTKYNYDPISLQVVDQSFEGTYRGLTYRVSHYRQPWLSRPNYHKMIYRGVTY